MESVTRAWMFEEGKHRVQVEDLNTDNVRITIGGESIQLYKQGLPALAQILNTVHDEWERDICDTSEPFRKVIY